MILAATSPEYYAVSAQVLPVLLIALLFEMRTSGTVDPGFRLIYILIGVTFLTVAEAAALHAVARGPNSRTDDLLLFGYFGGALAIVVDQIEKRVREAVEAKLVTADKTWPLVVTYLTVLAFLLFGFLFAFGSL